LFAEPKRLARVRDNGMRADFSWRQTTAQYDRLYAKIKKTGCVTQPALGNS